MAKRYKLVSWNVNGLRAIQKKGFYDWLLESGADAVGLQEIKIQPDQVTLDMVSVPGYTPYWAHGERAGYSGVALYCKEAPLSITEGLGIPRFDCEGRTIIAEYPEFTLYNIYYPNGQRGDDRLQYKLEFYDAFLEHAEALRKQGKRVIACGDFNTAHHPIDLARPKANESTSGFLPIERAWMDKFVEHGYIDTFRHFHPDVPDQYSWWNMRARARERNVGWRIDYFFASEELKGHLAAATIEPDVMGSDHCPVTLELEF